MKLSKIYSNKPFKNVSFHDGLNVIIGKISKRDDTHLDSHNLGKSLLLEVIDFLLLKEITTKEKYFLTKHPIFADYAFFAELKLNNGKYLLIRRSVENNTKISFKLNETKLSGFDIDIIGWDDELPIKKAKDKLNKFLGFDVLPGMNYRKSINYFMRYQNDYIDVFKLSKFQGIHKDWKPMVFELFGFDGKLLHDKLDLEDRLSQFAVKLEILETENKVNSGDRDKIVGLIDIKKIELDSLTSQIDKFNFFEKENIEKDVLVNEIENSLKRANTEHYAIKYEIDKIERSISNKVDSIDVDYLKKLYDEVQIFFPDNLINEYEKVINFNKQITSERNKYLYDNLEKLKIDLAEVEQRLKGLESQKSAIFIDLTDKSTYDKFKKYQKDLAKAEANILVLEDRLSNINTMSQIQADIASLDAQIKNKVDELKKGILKQNHKNIRHLFNEFTMSILNTPAILSVKLNKNNNIDFEAEYQNKEELISTDLASGHTYKKILCAAFDTSLIQNYKNNSFYKFVYHDGILDTLDIRKKEKYIKHIREIVRQSNMQYILTIIESETYGISEDYKFTADEICLILSDESCQSKLFEKCF